MHVSSSLRDGVIIALTNAAAALQQRITPKSLREFNIVDVSMMTGGFLLPKMSVCLETMKWESPF